MFKQQLKIGAASGILSYADDKIREEMASANPPIEHRREFSTLEIFKAQILLMSGPRATPPTWRATRKTILRMNKGLPIKGSWRRWASA